MTIEEAKDKVADNHGWTRWSHIPWSKLLWDKMEMYINEAILLYAEQYKTK